MSDEKLKLGCTCYGDKKNPPVVFSPGWATDFNIFTPLKDLLDKYYIIIVDMPGYGKSKELGKYADDIIRCASLLLNTVPDGCTLVSWSLSSLIGILACSKDRTHKIKRFITLCGTPRFPSDPMWPGFDYKYVLKTFSLFEKGDPQKSIRLFFMLQTQGNALTQDQKNFLLCCYEKMGKIELKVLKSGLFFMSHVDLRAAMASLKIPCLHIFGQKDRLVKPELASKLSILPNHECVIFKNSAHTPFLSEPLLFKQYLEKFMERSSAQNKEN